MDRLEDDFELGETVFLFLAFSFEELAVVGDNVLNEQVDIGLHFLDVYVRPQHQVRLEAGLDQV